MVYSFNFKDPLEHALKQIKDLEVGLAKTKLELVESQCCNQDLNHQLNALIAEIQSNRNSWQPWLTKTINSIQEKVASSKRDTPSFLSHISQSTTPTLNSLVRLIVCFCIFFLNHKNAFFVVDQSKNQFS